MTDPMAEGCRYTVMVIALGLDLKAGGGGT